MRPEIKALYTSEIRRKVITAFCLDEAKLLSDWHAETYGGLRDGLMVVLRISHAAHRNRAQVEGNWIGRGS